MRRAEKLLYHGGRMKPRRVYPFAPARTLDAKDIARLTDEQYEALVTAPDGMTPVYAEQKKRRRKVKDADGVETESDEEDTGDESDDDQATDVGADETGGAGNADAGQEG
jgi:hypothetical protein